MSPLKHLSCSVLPKSRLGKGARSPRAGGNADPQTIPPCFIVFLPQLGGRKRFPSVFRSAGLPCSRSAREVPVSPPPLLAALRAQLRRGYRCGGARPPALLLRGTGGALSPLPRVSPNYKGRGAKGRGARRKSCFLQLLVTVLLGNGAVVVGLVLCGVFPPRPCSLLDNKGVRGMLLNKKLVRARSAGCVFQRLHYPRHKGGSFGIMRGAFCKRW